MRDKVYDTTETDDSTGTFEGNEQEEEERGHREWQQRTEDEAKRNIFIEEARLLRKKAIEEKQRKFETSVASEKEREEYGHEESKRLENRKGKEENARNQQEVCNSEDIHEKKSRFQVPKSKPTELNIYLRYGEDEEKRKQAFLEEARRLKQEAIEKKRNREESNAKENEETVQEDEQRFAYESKQETIQRKGSKEGVFFKTNGMNNFDEDNIKKEPYLEGARMMKELALEEQRKETNDEESVKLDKDFEVQQADAVDEGFCNKSTETTCDSPQHNCQCTEENRAGLFAEILSKSKATENQEYLSDREPNKDSKEAVVIAQEQASESYIPDSDPNLFRQESKLLEAIRVKAEVKPEDVLVRSDKVEEVERKHDVLPEIKMKQPSSLNHSKHLNRDGSQLRSEADEVTPIIPSSAAQTEKSPPNSNVDLRELPEPHSNNTKKILRELDCIDTRRNKLEKSLIQNGIPITADITYEEAKDKIAEITESMKALTASEMDSCAMEKKYYYFEGELSKYVAALMLTDEYTEEHQRLEKDWEDSIESENIIAIQKLRSHMPVKIRHMTEEQLVTSETPNGKKLPKNFARKFKRTNIIQLIRVNPDDIEMMHPSLLESTRTTGLTLTERRALHHHFKAVVERWGKRKSDPSVERKWQWYQAQKSKFKETLNAYLRCVEQYGPPGNHRYAKRNDPSGEGCTLLGNQCPLRADATMDYSEDYGYTKEPIYENSDEQSESKTESTRVSTLLIEKLPAITKSSEAEIVQEYRDRLRLDPNETEVDKKLLRELYHSDKRIKSLEKQLTQAGLSLPKEDISYSVAKERMAELTAELKQIAIELEDTRDGAEIAKLERTFGELSRDLDKFTNALMLTKEWNDEQKEKEHQWEVDVSAANYEALQSVRRHMPVNIRNMSEKVLTTNPTPNGKLLPNSIAKKFKRTNILMILRTDPSVIEQMHPSSLEAMRTTGLTLTERRAIHEHLKEIAPKWKAMASDKMYERKWTWHASLQGKFKEMLGKYNAHIEQYGPPSNHPYQHRDDPNGGGCPLIGIQCPIKGDLMIDYSSDYGYPDGAVYEQQTVAKSNLLSMQEFEKRRREDDYGYN